MRLGVYADLVYRLEGDTLSTDRAFILFVTGLAPRLGEVVLFGRLDPEPGRAPYVLPKDGIRHVAFPHYPSVTDVGGVLRALRRARSVFAAELHALDAVWIFGPHPLALALVREARKHGTPAFLGVRQDLPQYIGNRLPSRRWAWAIPVAHALERTFRRLARTHPTVVVGADLGRKYGGGPLPVLATGFSLIRASELVPLDDALGRSWDGDELRLLSVGRLDAEKNPLLLADILARLRAQDPRWRLTVVGRGPLEDALRRRAADHGVDDALTFAGYVTYGPELLDLYRGSHAFLHVSLTEGLPQVLFEAQASGLPVVGTDVGGVSAALGGGERGLVVPPRDAEAAAVALERLRDEPELRRRLVTAALEHAASETLDAQLERVAEYFRPHVPGS